MVWVLALQLDEEAGSTAADSSGNGLDFALSAFFSTGGGGWGSDGAGATLDGDGTADNEYPLESVDGTAADWAGVTQFTAYQYLDLTDQSGLSHFPFQLTGGNSDSTGDMRLAMRVRASGEGLIAIYYWPDGDGANSAVQYFDFLSDAGPVVIALVIDTTESSADDRIKLYAFDGGSLNGLQSRKGSSSAVGFAQDDTLDDPGSAAAIGIGCHVNGAMGNFHLRYTADDASTVATIAAALLSDHDAEPEGSAGYTLSLDGASVPIAAQDMSPLHGRYLSLDAAAVPVAGQDLSPLRGYPLALDSAAVPIAGSDLGTLYGRALALDSSPVPVAGQDVGLLYGRLLALDTSPVPIAGADLGTLYGRALALDGSSVPIAGQDVGLVYTPSGSYILSLEGSSVPVAGSDLGALYGRVLALDGSSVPLAGADLGLLYGRALALEGAAVPVAGSDLGTLFGRVLALDGSAVPVAGQDVGFSRGYPLALDGAAVPVAGADLGFLRSYVLALDGADVPVAGYDVALIYSGAPEYFLIFLPRVEGPFPTFDIAAGSQHVPAFDVTEPVLNFDMAVEGNWE